MLVYVDESNTNEQYDAHVRLTIEIRKLISFLAYQYTPKAEGSKGIFIRRERITMNKGVSWQWASLEPLARLPDVAEYEKADIQSKILHYQGKGK